MASNMPDRIADSLGHLVEAIGLQKLSISEDHCQWGAQCVKGTLDPLLISLNQVTDIAKDERRAGDPARSIRQQGNCMIDGHYLVVALEKQNSSEEHGLCRPLL